MQALSQHTLLEFYDCDRRRLKRSREVKKLLCESVRSGGGTIVKALFHNFSPHGVSGVVVITESHVTIHTWPEHGYAAVDIFSCSEKLDHKLIRDHLKRALSSHHVVEKSFLRGVLPIASLHCPAPTSSMKGNPPGKKARRHTQPIR